MKEYRPIKVANPFTKFYTRGGAFLFLIIFSILEDNFIVKIGILGSVAISTVIFSLALPTIKYTVLLRFEDNSLRIEYLDYRKKSLFMQIPYFELSAKLSTERVSKRYTQTVLNIARNGKKMIKIDESNSNFSKNKLSEIYDDILKINTLNG